MINMKKKEYFVVLRLSRDDIIQTYLDPDDRMDEGLRKRIESLSDEEMQHIADRLGECLMTWYWDSVRACTENDILEGVSEEELKKVVKK